MRSDWRLRACPWHVRFGGGLWRRLRGWLIMMISGRIGGCRCAHLSLQVLYRLAAVPHLKVAATDRERRRLSSMHACLRGCDRSRHVAQDKAYEQAPWVAFKPHGVYWARARGEQSNRGRYRHMRRVADVLSSERPHGTVKGTAARSNPNPFTLTPLSWGTLTRAWRVGTWMGQSTKAIVISLYVCTGVGRSLLVTAACRFLYFLVWKLKTSKEQAGGEQMDEWKWKQHHRFTAHEHRVPTVIPSGILSKKDQHNYSSTW